MVCAGEAPLQALARRVSRERMHRVCQIVRVLPYYVRLEHHMNITETYVNRKQTHTRRIAWSLRSLLRSRTRGRMCWWE